MHERSARETSWAPWCRRFLVASGAVVFACGGSTSDINRAHTNDGDAATDAGAGGLSDGGSGGRAGVETGGRATGGTPSGGTSAITGGAAPDASASGGVRVDSGVTGGASGSGGAIIDATIDDGPATTWCAPTGTGDFPRASGLYLIGGSNTANTTEVLAIDLSSMQTVGRTVFTNADVIFPIASGGRGFILERYSAALNVLSSTGTVVRRILLSPIPADARDVVLVPGQSKAYVSLNWNNSILIVDVDAGVVNGAVDIGGFMGPADTDGFVDARRGFFDPGSLYVYFALARIDRNTASAPPYRTLCPSQRSLLIAIDTVTDQLVDLDPAGPGMGLELNFVDPVDIVFDATDRSALVLASGCFEGPVGGLKLARHGVESVKLDAATSWVQAFEDEQQQFNVLLQLADGTKLAGAINYGEWLRVDARRFGCLFSGIGFYPVVEQGDVVLSLEAYSYPDGGYLWNLRRAKVLSSLEEQPVRIPFTTTPTVITGTTIVR